MRSPASNWQHAHCSRRTALQAGAATLLGLGAGHLDALRAAGPGKHKARAVIYIFLSGGLGQHDSFDLKPDAPAEIRGEFKPSATATPGIAVCEHLPLLAQRSRHWALVRSLGHPSNAHSEGHHMMLTGRTELPPGFNPNMPRDTDWPSMASIARAVTKPRNNLPPAAVLPEKLVHNSGRVIPGQFAGMMGRPREPWFIEASPFEPKAYGAYPEFEFDHQERPRVPTRTAFQIPNLSLSHDMAGGRLSQRLGLLRHIDGQRRDLDQLGAVRSFDRHQQNALSLLTEGKVRQAFDVLNADPKVLDRYGRNAFGWSLLMARRLVEAGVNLVQVNLGNNETWDTHGNAFPHLKDKLLPPTDRAVAALLDDLHDAGMLDSTLVVMAGEFGRTPRLSTLSAHYKGPGRDHWGAVQTAFFAGGGVKGGTVVGASDKNGGYPADSPQTPDNMAATIYESLGIPKSTMWQDAQDRPHHVYHGEPIIGLT